nr:PREDICTED: serine protease 55-like [Latimeria chalumnae]|eukprot:XP_006010167.2 PREDICTED: serine protease 55-like [Latimeria chalumnae]
MISQRYLLLLSILKLAGLCSGAVCGEQKESLGVDASGVRVVVGEFPWQTSLQVNAHYCSGSILSKWWILTSGVCATGPPLRPGDRFYVLTGSVDSYTDDPHYEAKRKFPHHRLNLKATDNDVGLVLLKEPIAFDEDTMPVCLAVNPEKDLADVDDCWITGWGVPKNESGYSSQMLWKLAMRILPQVECAEYWVNINQKKFCAKAKYTEKSLCRGDRGDPLVCRDKNTRIWSQVGITSGIGQDCKGPSLFMRVSHYVNWMVKTTVAAGKPLFPPVAPPAGSKHKASWVRSVAAPSAESPLLILSFIVAVFML